MDDDKNIIEKAIEVVKDIAHTATEAAKYAMEPEPIKPGDEVVYMPATGTGTMGDSMMPPFVVIPKKAARKKTPDMSGRITPTYDFPAPTSEMPVKKKTPKSEPKAETTAKKKTVKKSSKKRAAKKWKSPAKKSAKKSTGKKAVKKKKAKKSKR
jgi:hypothetical protein